MRNAAEEIWPNNHRNAFEVRTPGSRRESRIFLDIIAMPLHYSARHPYWWGVLLQKKRLSPVSNRPRKACARESVYVAVCRFGIVSGFGRPNVLSRTDWLGRFPWGRNSAKNRFLHLSE
jgi:hypothetical protein